MHRLERRGHLDGVCVGDDSTRGTQPCQVQQRLDVIGRVHAEGLPILGVEVRDVGEASSRPIDRLGDPRHDQHRHERREQASRPEDDVVGIADRFERRQTGLGISGKHPQVREPAPGSGDPRLAGDGLAVDHRLQTEVQRRCR